MMNAAEPSNPTPSQASSPDITELIRTGAETILTNQRGGNARPAANRASSMGHPCEEFLRLSRVAWDRRRAPSTTSLGVMETGNMAHDATWRLLMKIGEASGEFDVVSRETSFYWEGPDISGTIDGIFINRADKSAIAGFDIKSVGQAFDSINTLEDIQSNRYRRFWIAQATCYMMLTGIPRYFVVMVARDNLFSVKLVEIPLDYDYAEQLAQKAERVNRAIKESTPCAKLNDPQWCVGCPLAHVCMPSLSLEDNSVAITDSEVSSALDIMTANEAAYDAYTAAEKTVQNAIKAHLPECSAELVGTFKTIVLPNRDPIYYAGSKRSYKPSAGGTSFFWRKVRERGGDES